MEGRTKPTAREAARQGLEHELGLAAHWLVYSTVNGGLVVAAEGFTRSWWGMVASSAGLAVHACCLWFEVGRLKNRLPRRQMARTGQGP